MAEGRESFSTRSGLPVEAAPVFSLPSPCVSASVGWAVAESIKWIVAPAQCTESTPRDADVEKLLSLLREDRLHQAAHALDQLADQFDAAEHKREYKTLCDAVEEAGFILATLDKSLASAKTGLQKDPMWKRDPRELLEVLEPFSDKTYPAVMLSDLDTSAKAGKGWEGLDELHQKPVTVQRSSTEEYDSTVASVSRHQEKGLDPPSLTSASSVEELPPSLKECFIDFAAFPPGAQVPEADLVHLFATHAPLHTPHSVRAAARKLQELNQRRLVSIDTSSHGLPIYCMNESLWQEAHRSAQQARHQRRFQHGDINASKLTGNVRYFSLHEEEPSPLSKAMAACGVQDGWLRACILGTCAATSMPGSKAGKGLLQYFRRLQYLSIRGEVTAQMVETLASTDMRLLSFVSVQGCRSNDATALVESLAVASRLAHLDVSGCKGMFWLPDSIGKHMWLMHLNLSGCDTLVGLPESIGDCRQLTYLDLGRCKGVFRLPGSIGGCSQLMNLDVSGCDALAGLPESIGQCSQLRHLDLSCCKYAHFHLPERIRLCSQLTQLNFRGCKGMFQLPHSIGGCNPLMHLDLNGCEALEELPESIGKCSQLTHIDLSGCKEVFFLPGSISGCDQLIHLNLSGCEALQKLPQSIGKCSQLKQVNLSRCQGLTQLPASMGFCRQLTHLDLSGCYCLDMLPVSVRRLLPNLKLPRPEPTVRFQCSRCSKHDCTDRN